MVTTEQYQQENWDIQRFFDNEYSYKIETYPHERYVTFEKPQYRWVESYGDFLPVEGIPIQKVSRAKVLEYIRLCKAYEKIHHRYATLLDRTDNLHECHMCHCAINSINTLLHSERFNWVKSIAKEI